MRVLNLFTNDLTSCQPPELHQAILALAQSGVEEHFRLEFKETWKADEQCQDIAAFANSYGGLLIVGVTNDRQGFPGIPMPPTSDLKTQLDSTIATRISPVPICEVHTCPAPANAGHALALIRVSPQPKLHLYLKGDRPVYVRNGDQTVPARATDLQALLDRVRNAEASGQQLIDPSVDIARDFYVSKATNLSATFAERQDVNKRWRSETFCRVTAIPERPLQVGLDVTLEQRFRHSIYSLYPSLAQRLLVGLGTSIAKREDRRGSWYRYHHLDLERDHEGVWAFNSAGTIQYICEASGRVGTDAADLWSLVDFFVNLDGTLGLTHEMWTSLGYFGAGRFVVQLSVPKLVPIINETHYQPLFHETSLLIPRDAARNLYANYEVSTGRGELLLTYDGRTSQRTETLVTVGNQVLRDLRFGVDVAALRGVLQQFSAF